MIEHVFIQHILPFVYSMLMKLYRNFASVFRRCETTWRFSEFFAKICEHDSLEFPIPKKSTQFISRPAAIEARWTAGAPKPDRLPGRFPRGLLHDACGGSCCSAAWFIGAGVLAKLAISTVWHMRSCAK